jgi:hypothetical protein
MTTPAPAAPEWLQRIWQWKPDTQPENPPTASVHTVDVENEAAEAEDTVVLTQSEEVHREAVMQSVSFVKRSVSAATLREDVNAKLFSYA